MCACVRVCVCACSFLSKYYVVVLQGRYAAYVGSYSLTFLDSPSVPSLRVKQFVLHCWTLGSVSVNNYKDTLHKTQTTNDRTYTTEEA